MRKPERKLPTEGRTAGNQGSAGKGAPPLSEAMLRAVLASVLDPTITIDVYGNVLQASDSVLKVFGWSPEELVGKNISVLMPEPHGSQHDQYLANYRRTGVTHILNRTREFSVRRKDGVLIDCELSVARTDLDGERAQVFTGAFRDITIRKRVEQALRQSERRFHAIFDGSFQYAGLLEPDGTLIEINRAALEVAGLQREDVLGRRFWETHWWSLDPAMSERCKDAVQRAAAGEFVRFETSARAKGDAVISIDFSLTPVADDTGKVVLLIPEGRDTTELKRAQRAETQMLRALATIGESAAVLAHEIKNPITAINVALRAVADQLGQDHRVILEDLSSRMMRLERMLRRTLSFAKPVELRFETVDLADTIISSVRLLRPMIVAAGVDVRMARDAGPTRVQGDRGLLEEVVTNILANAVEALEAPGALEGRAARGIVDIRLDHLERGEVRILIEDNGPGVPEKLQRTLFQPYVTTKSRGTGLGLAFCKKVIEEHHGSITVGKSQAGGASFTVVLPGVQPRL
jgi:two-component system sensor histidine kinase/response regulator